MTKYSCRKNGEGIALFADDVPLDAMIAFALSVTENCCADTDIIDMDTGEIVFSMVWREAPDDVDESFYDPYLGCDVFE